MDIRFWVKKYLDEGWSPIPIPKGEKGPRISGWESQDFSPSDFDDESNIGVHLGRAGIYDVDLDCKEAIVAADILLPPTDRISGRPSKLRSHRFYRCVDPVTHKPYHGLGGTNDTILELRGFTNTGTPTQTVVPPSVHPSGERIGWEHEGKLAEVAKDWLESCVRNVAIAVLVARGFPGSGNRHLPRMALAGFLKKAGVAKDEAREIGRAVMAIIGGDVNDWLDVARTTYERDDELPTLGGKSLGEMLTDGVEIVRRLNKWLGREDIAQEDDAIEQLNKRFCILKLASEVVVADFEDEARIDFYKFDTFHKLLIKDTLPGKKKKDGSWSKERQLSDVWIRHKKGRKQGQLVYAPPGSPIKLKASDFNGWMGFAVKPTPGDWPLLERHLRDVLCGGDLELYFWVLNWCADLLQRPGAHGWTALVLQGGQGTGKGFFANDLLGRMFHPRHYSSPSRQAVFGDFPDVLSGKSLIFMDEATWGGDPKDNGKIKGFITGDKLSINRKNLSIAEEVSMLHFIFASNEDWPVGVERDDRRFAVLEVKNSQANSPAYFKPLYEELETIGRAAFLDFLLNHWTIDHDALRTPPASKKREELKRRSMKPVDEWWMYRLADGKLLPHHKGWETKVPVHELFLAYVAAMQNQGVNRRESPPQFSQHLVKISGATRMRNANKRELNFLSLDATREEFDRYLNTKTDWENV